MRKVKVVGKPYEGKPHVRFEVAGGGNQDLGARRHSLTLPADGADAYSALRLMLGRYASMTNNYPREK